MTEPLKAPKAFVNRINRGDTRWFFAVSVPHDYLDELVDPGLLTKEPDRVAKKVADLVDRVFLQWRDVGF